MVKKKDSKDDRKLFAFLAVFLSIVGFIIALITKREDRYVMFYAKESLVLFIVAVVLNVAGHILAFVTLGALYMVNYLIGLVILLFWIIQIVYALSGEEKSTPIIGQYTKHINLWKRGLKTWLDSNCIFIEEKNVKDYLKDVLVDIIIEGDKDERD